MGKTVGVAGLGERPWSSDVDKLSLRRLLFEWRKQVGSLVFEPAVRGELQTGAIYAEQSAYT